jgi:hypothetical protein
MVILIDSTVRTSYLTQAVYEQGVGGEHFDEELHNWTTMACPTHTAM